MIKKHISEIEAEAVSINGARGATIQWLITDQDGAQHFAMRRFEIAPHGIVPLHAHPEEHEIYVISGKANILEESGEKVEVTAGSILYIPPFEKHGYEIVGTKPFIFLCIIPLLKK